MRETGSSTTWSRTSTTSSTSDRVRRAVLTARVVHPFPSVLDGLATAAIAVLAGGDPTTVVRLGVAMTAIQFGIGALNDLTDAPRDAGRADKPIPAGLVAPRTASSVTIAGVAAGLLLSIPSGLPTVVVAAIGASIGVVYDLRLKGTPWAPLAYAIGIPLLPVYAWLGATGSLPAVSVIVLPAAAFAGASLAIANALVDVEHDRAAGIRTPATAMGPRRAWLVAATLAGAVGAVAVATLALWGGSGPGLGITVLGLALASGGLVVLRSRVAERRERGWQAQAIGTALLAVGWLAAIADAGLMAWRGAS